MSAMQIQYIKNRTYSLPTSGSYRTPECFFSSLCNTTHGWACKVLVTHGTYRSKYYIFSIVCEMTHRLTCIFLASIHSKSHQRAHTTAQNDCLSSTGRRQQAHQSQNTSSSIDAIARNMLKKQSKKNIFFGITRCISDFYYFIYFKKIQFFETYFRVIIKICGMCLSPKICIYNSMKKIN